MRKLLTFVTALFLANASYAQIGPITGHLTACPNGGSSSLSDTTLGGTWSSSNTAVSTVSPSGFVVGLMSGTTTITYTVGSSFATAILTVSVLDAIISPTSYYCVGHTYLFADSTPGCIWTTLDTSLAHINAVTGVFTTISPGISAIDYTDSMTGCLRWVEFYIHDTCLTTSEPNIKTSNSFVTTYPNPANNELNIKWQETATESGNLIIYDITGREIYTTAMNMTEGEGTFHIDMSAFNNGLYLISIISGNFMYNDKIQVIH